MNLPRFPDGSNPRQQPARRLARACLVVAAAAGLAAPAALAQQRLQNVEQCIESASDMLSLPTSPSGALTARACWACDSQALDFSRDTRYYIGDEEVSYSRLRSLAGTRPMSVYVFYRTGTRTLTRLRLDADAGKASQ